MFTNKSTDEKRKIILNLEEDTIKRELEKKLKEGIQTNFVGNFLLIPYLQQLNIEELIKHLGIKKQHGIPFVLLI